MKQLTKSLGMIALLTIFGCSENSDRACVEMAGLEMAAPTTEQKASAPATIDRKLIKEGRVEFETDHLGEARKTMWEAVDKYEGYVSSDKEYRSPGRISNTVVIRVPANDFDKLLRDATQGVERFDRKEIDTKDVTEEFLDIQARLKTKKELEQRYIDLLEEARNVTEILEIEKQIGLLRSDIESIEGRLKYLQNRVSFSTLTMTCYEVVPHETAFGQKFKKGFENGWDNLIWFFVALTNIWPFLLLGIGTLVGIRLYRRNKTSEKRG